jgi:hypothetical protein
MSSPSAGLNVGFGEPLDHPQVLDGLLTMNDLSRNIGILGHWLQFV